MSFTISVEDRFPAVMPVARDVAERCARGKVRLPAGRRIVNRTVFRSQPSDLLLAQCPATEAHFGYMSHEERLFGKVVRRVTEAVDRCCPSQEFHLPKKQWSKTMLPACGPGSMAL